LFVEDDENDFMLACAQIAKMNLRNPVYRVRNEEELFRYLYGGGEFVDREKFPAPVVIVLDLRLNGISGLEIQARLRASLKFRSIAIIVISSSDKLAQLKGAVELGANAWMTKPFDHADFTKVSADMRLPLEFLSVT